MTRACSFLFGPPDNIPCVALAEPGGSFCAVHRCTDPVERVKKAKGKIVPVLCVCCHLEIRPGHLQRLTKDGPVHAEYQCGES